MLKAKFQAILIDIVASKSSNIQSTFLSKWTPYILDLASEILKNCNISFIKNISSSDICNDQQMMYLLRHLLGDDSSTIRMANSVP